MRVRSSSKALICGIVGLPAAGAIAFVALNASTSGSTAFTTPLVFIEAAVAGTLTAFTTFLLVWSRALCRTENVANMNDESAVCITSVRVYNIESSLEPMGSREQFSHYFTVLLDTEGLSIWSGRPERPKVVFSASSNSVASVMSGSINRGFGGYRGILIDLKMPTGEVLRAEFPVLSSRVFGYVRTSPIREIEKLLESRGFTAGA